MKTYDVIIIGAGAAGLMAAIHAGQRGRVTLLIESGGKIGEKIRISGGGRCNFTNLGTTYKNYLSANPSFIISSLARYSPQDFIKMVENYGIAYHEKTLGQLFCDGSSMQIIDMLLTECRKYNVEIFLNCRVNHVTKSDNFELATSSGDLCCKSLIIATGGLSIPKIGGSDFGYRLASQFGIRVLTTRPALVPLLADDEFLSSYKQLSGIAIHSVVTLNKISFKENILFTHRGLSGPAILQISSYLNVNETQPLEINLAPELDLEEQLLNNQRSKLSLGNFLKNYLPNRFVESHLSAELLSKKLVDYSKKQLIQIGKSINCFNFYTAGNEGYAKAEVTAGGVDTNELSSKTMMCKKVPNLYFIGEVVDVTGWLGGYNFQWAWSSGYTAGTNA